MTKKLNSKQLIKRIRLKTQGALRSFILGHNTDLTHLDDFLETAVKQMVAAAVKDGSSVEKIATEGKVVCCFNGRTLTIRAYETEEEAEAEGFF